MSTEDVTEKVTSYVTEFDDKTEEEELFYPNRVFINHLDTFHGRHIARILADKIFRDKQEGGGEGEAEEEPPAATTADIVGYVPPKQHYQIIGSSRSRHYHATEDVLMVLNEDDEKFFKEISKCGYIVYDITYDPDEIPKALNMLKAIAKLLEEMKEDTPKKFANLPEQRVFVLISTIMTWAKTRPVDPDDPEVAFTDSDFRKRKPHPNYKPHIDLEKEVIAIGKQMKPQLITVVIATGLTYGEEEEDLHFLFKTAWVNELDLPIMQPANNIIPLINVKDLISVLYGVLENVPKKPKYILAVEQTTCTQKQIVKTLAKVLGNSRSKIVTQAESFLYPEMTQTTHERLTVNLRMEPNYIVNDLEIPWVTDLNFAENIYRIVKEYKQARKLYAINVIVHGPPAVGKTTIAHKIADFYDLHYISVATLITENLASLRSNIEYGKEQLKLKMDKAEAPDEEEAEDEEDEEEEDWEGKIEEWTEKLKEIERGLDESVNGKLPDHIIIPMLRETLQTNLCQNHGYVLDGYPKNIEQTKELFEIGEADQEEADEEEEEEEDEEGDEEPKKHILPNYVITLEASDEFLCNRIMHLPELEVQDTHYTEEHMIRRLGEFRTNNTDENTMLNIFDEREIHPYSIDAETDDIDAIFELVRGKIGPKYGYPLSDYELEQLRLRKEEEMNRQMDAARRAREEQERTAQEKYEQNMELWANLLQQLQHEEQQQLTAQCKPLREYLVRFVFPTLTRGLQETARIKPEDPVDFLAEYLFKENPEGRMFDPAYVAAADDLFKTIETFKRRLGD